MKKIRIITVVSFLVVLFFSFSRPIFAQTPTDDTEVWNLREGWKTVVEWSKEVTLNPFEDIQKLLAKMPYTVTANLIAEIAPEVTTSYPEISASNLPPIMKHGVMGMAELQLVSMFNAYPRVDVIAHLSNEWVPGYEETQSVYAGGYEDLQRTGIDSLWSLTRDIAYLGFVVIMIAIGFMIMFRSKIGGQTMVTVGNSIPRVVVSLILVTFSFAIIGLIIDVAGVLMGVVASVLDLSNAVNPMDVFQMLRGVFGLQSVGWFGGALAFGAAGIAIAIISVLSLATGPMYVATLFMNIILLIILGIITFGIIKLWFVLVKSYFALLINVVVAPLAILVGAFPGNQIVTSNLFKSALRNALVFPLAFTIVNLPYALDINQISLNFPSTFFPQNVIQQAVLNVNVGRLMIAVAKIMAIYVAAQSPIFLKSVIPAAAPKSGVDAAAAIKQSFVKMPVIGGLFKDKK